MKSELRHIIVHLFLVYGGAIVLQLKDYSSCIHDAHGLTHHNINRGMHTCSQLMDVGWISIGMEGGGAFKMHHGHEKSMYWMWMGPKCIMRIHYKEYHIEQYFYQLLL